jgi:hypothetical protein
MSLVITSDSVAVWYPRGVILNWSGEVSRVSFLGGVMCGGSNKLCFKVGMNFFTISVGLLLFMKSHLLSNFYRCGGELLSGVRSL